MKEHQLVKASMDQFLPLVRKINVFKNLDKSLNNCNIQHIN